MVWKSPLCGRHFVLLQVDFRICSLLLVESTNQDPLRLESTLHELITCDAPSVQVRECHDHPRGCDLTGHPQRRLHRFLPRRQDPQDQVRWQGRRHLNLHAGVDCFPDLHSVWKKHKTGCQPTTKSQNPGSVGWYGHERRFASLHALMVTPPDSVTTRSCVSTFIHYLITSVTRDLARSASQLQ